MDEVDFPELQKNSEEFLPGELFLRTCISTVSESLDQLAVLKNINDWPEDGSTPYTYRTPEQRFSDQTGDSQFKKVDNLTLFRRNCVFIHSLLVNLLSDLINTGSFEGFETALQTFHLMKYDEEKILTASSKKEKEMNELQTIFSEEKLSFIEQILNCMAKIGKIKDDTENFLVEGDMKLKYITAWENSQIEMVNTQSTQTQLLKREKINRTNVDITQEERVHQEILLSYNWFQKELETKLEDWRQKYVTDMNEFNEKLDALQEKQDQQLEKIRSIKELYAKRQKEMEDYKRYKVEQEKLRKEMERNVQAATKIQAWWRGTMVRKGYGKYRRKKEKKVKKKSSEKKSAK